MQQYYTLENGTHQPLNTIPFDMIKCSICDKYFRIFQIEYHLSSHIKPQFLLPQTKTQNIKKIGVSKTLFDDINSDNTDIAIRSMLPNELPQPQIPRKKIKIPHGTDQIIKINNLDKDLKSVKEDTCDLVSRIGNKQLQQEQVQILNIQQNIEISVVKGSIQKRQIHLYKNNKVTNQVSDGSVIHKKHIVKVKEIQDDTGYQLIPKENNQNIDVQEIQYSKISSLKVPFSFIRRPGSSLSINTFKKNHQKIVQIDANKTETQNNQYIHYESQNLEKTRIKCNCKCPCCGGFYCRVCNSSVPPQYRPVGQNIDNKSLKKNSLRQYWDKQNSRQQKLRCENCQ